MQPFSFGPAKFKLAVGRKRVPESSRSHRGANFIGSAATSRQATSARLLPMSNEETFKATALSAGAAKAKRPRAPSAVEKSM